MSDARRNIRLTKAAIAAAKGLITRSMSAAPPIRPFPLQAGHPANHGYVKCARCGTQRLASDVVDIEWTWHHEDHGPIRMDGPICVDPLWCVAQAKANGR